MFPSRDVMERCSGWIKLSYLNELLTFFRFYMHDMSDSSSCNYQLRAPWKQKVRKTNIGPDMKITFDWYPMSTLVSKFCKTKLEVLSYTIRDANLQRQKYNICENVFICNFWIALRIYVENITILIAFYDYFGKKSNFKLQPLLKEKCCWWTTNSLSFKLLSKHLSVNVIVKANRLILRKERKKRKKQRKRFFTQLSFTNYEQCLFRLHILCVSTMANYIQLNKQ